MSEWKMLCFTCRPTRCEEFHMPGLHPAIRPQGIGPCSYPIIVCHFLKIIQFLSGTSYKVSAIDICKDWHHASHCAKIKGNYLISEADFVQQGSASGTRVEPYRIPTRTNIWFSCEQGKAVNHEKLSNFKKHEIVNENRLKWQVTSHKVKTVFQFPSIKSRVMQQFSRGLFVIKIDIKVNIKGVRDSRSLRYFSLSCQCHSIDS